MAGRLSFEAVAGVGTEASDMASSDSAELQEIVNLAYALTELADGRLKINFFHGGKDGSIYGRYQNGRIDINADRVDANGANLMRITLSHELTHYIQDKSKTQYAKLKKFMLDRLMDEQNLTLEELIEEKQAREPGLGYEDAIDEIVADGCEEMLLDPSIVEELAKKEKSLARDIVNWLRGVLDRLVNSITGTHKEAVAMRQYAEVLRALWGKGLSEALASEETENNKNTAEDGGAKWSIKDDVYNKPFVEVDTDILAGVPQSDWVKTVKSNLKQKFPQGIKVGRSDIYIDRNSRREMTMSQYSQFLMRAFPTIYSDKMKATNNADEILHIADNYVNEGLKHKRKDDIIDFARGSARISIGEHDYKADVVVGMLKSGKLIFYDIVNLTPTTIKKKSADVISILPQSGLRQATTTDKNTISQTATESQGKFSRAVASVCVK